MNGTFCADILQQFSSLPDLSELRSALIVKGVFKFSSKLYIKLHEPMKRLLIMNTGFAFVKIHMEIALAKIRFADKG